MEKNAKRAYEAPESQVWAMAIAGSLCEVSVEVAANNDPLFNGFNNGQTNEEVW